MAACLALLMIPNVHHLAPSRYWTVELSEWTPDRIAARRIAVTTRREYQPRWLVARPSTPAGQVRVVSGRAEVSNQQRQPHRWSASIDGAELARLEVGIAYFPGWFVEGPNGSVPAAPDPASGLIALEVPAGRHEVAIVFRRTSLRWFGEGLTLVSLLAVVLLVREGRRTP